VCKICNTSYVQPASLQAHMNVHRNKRAYACMVCRKRFNQKGNLRTHYLQKHNADRPFLCKLCTRRFIFQGDLNRHLNKAHQLATNQTNPFGIEVEAVVVDTRGVNSSRRRRRNRTMATSKARSSNAATPKAAARSRGKRITRGRRRNSSSSSNNSSSSSSCSSNSTTNTTARRTSGYVARVYTTMKHLGKDMMQAELPQRKKPDRPALEIATNSTAAQKAAAAIRAAEGLPISQAAVSLFVESWQRISEHFKL